MVASVRSTSVLSFTVLGRLVVCGNLDPVDERRGQNDDDDGCGNKGRGASGRRILKMTTNPRDERRLLSAGQTASSLLVLVNVASGN